MENKPTQAVVKTGDDKSLVEFQPFGAQDKIKLSISIVKNLIAVPTKSGKTCSDRDAIKFIAMCQARRLNPFEGDAFLIGYDGKDGPTFNLITAHQAFLKRAEANAEFDGMKSGIIVERNADIMDLEGDFYLAGDKLLGGWATVFFKNRKQPMHKRIRLERFKKGYGIWLDDSAGMICKCAEADALRSSFPTMLGGLYLREETATPADVKVASAPVFQTPSSTYLPEKPEEPKNDLSEPGEFKTDVEMLLESAAKENIKESDLLSFLKDIGAVENDCSSLGEVKIKYPDAFDILLRTKEGVFEKIKSV
jgi:phage recombination protein Bet